MKSKNLEIMKKNGINVPKFFVLKWEELIDYNTFSAELSKCISQWKKDTLSKQSDCLNILLDRFIRVPEIILEKNVEYAVRSSCNMEDGMEYSFAGMFDTYLNVEAGDVSLRIKDCLKALYCKSALEYSILNHIDIAQMKMDVIVQEMVEGDFSGILFTSNPQGILNEAVITVGKGLGDAVVSDKIQTVTYYYNVSDKKYYYDGMEDLLSMDILDNLISIGENIKKIFDYPYADIEFSVIGNEIYILQARKITSFTEEETEVYDNSNIVESYPGITLPLSESFARAAYTGVFSGLARRIWKKEELIEQFSSLFENMVGSVNGAMYYKINNWYTLLQCVPFGKKIIPIWQEMLGVKDRKELPEKMKLSHLIRIKTYFNFVYEFFGVQKSMKKLNEHYEEVNRYFKKTFREDLTNEQLKELYRNVEEELLGVWDITLINDLYAFVFTAMAKKMDKSGRVYERISGIKDIESMKPVKELIQLAEFRLQNASEEEYIVRKNAYIDHYGDRTVEELKMESRTFRTNPELLDQKIEEYASDSLKLQEMKQKMMHKENELNGNMKEGFFERRAVAGIRNREISRLNRTRIYGMVRSIFQAVGKNFVLQNRLESAEDIYYLKIEEIFDEMNTHRDLRKITKERKKEYENFKSMPIYNRIVATKTGLQKLNHFEQKQKQIFQTEFLSGVPCSFGKVTGSVLVIESAKEIKNTKNKILVARMTDPGWVFLLASAKGIITEKGSLLSHTAIIARELRIPSIVAVENATELLKNGDIIEMDGSTGDIHILPRKCEK